MQKQIIKALTLIAAGTLILGSALAQQTPATHIQPAPASPATTAPKATTHPATAPKSPTVLTLKTTKDKASYAIGMNLGKNLHHDAVDIDPNILLRGLKDALAGSKPLLTDDEMKASMIALQGDVRKRQEARMQMAAGTNKKAGEAFLSTNKTKAGVVTLPSGLQY